VAVRPIGASVSSGSSWDKPYLIISDNPPTRERIQSPTDRARAAGPIRPTHAHTRTAGQGT